jgi:hypothetical protein
MTYNTTSTILYVIGIVILIFTNTYILICNKKPISKNTINIHIIIAFSSIILLIFSWIIKVRSEKYQEGVPNYDYAMNTGCSNGSVCTKNYPSGAGPSLGWIL